MMSLERDCRRFTSILSRVSALKSHHATSILWWECSTSDEFWLVVMSFCSLWMLCTSSGCFPTENFVLLVKMWPGGSPLHCFQQSFQWSAHFLSDSECSWRQIQLSLSLVTNDRANATNLDGQKWMGRKRGQILWNFIPNHPKIWCILVFLSSEISKK